MSPGGGAYCRRTRLQGPVENPSMKSFLPRSPLARRGALTTGCIVGLVAAGILLIVGMWGVSRYNSMASGKANVAAKWANIDNFYKRRFDLIPQLVEVVQGSANFEKSTLQAVVDARASVGKIQMPADALDDPAKMQQYVAAQQALSGTLSRLIATAESYPNLKTSEGFLNLQSQVEGADNRIATARTDYIEAVRDYNRSLVTFPGNLIAGVFGFREIPQLEAATPEERAVPKIDFGGNESKK